MTNVFLFTILKDHETLHLEQHIRKSVKQNFSCTALLLSFWKCLEYIAVLLAGFSKNLRGRCCCVLEC